MEQGCFCCCYCLVADGGKGGGGFLGVVVVAEIPFPVTTCSVYIRSLIQVTREYLKTATCERETKQSDYGKYDVL